MLQNIIHAICAISAGNEQRFCFGSTPPIHIYQGSGTLTTTLHCEFVLGLLSHELTRKGKWILDLPLVAEN